MSGSKEAVIWLLCGGVALYFAAFNGLLLYYAAFFPPVIVCISYFLAKRRFEIQGKAGVWEEHALNSSHSQLWLSAMVFYSLPMITLFIAVVREEQAIIVPLFQSHENVFSLLFHQPLSYFKGAGLQGLGSYDMAKVLIIDTMLVFWLSFVLCSLPTIFFFSKCALQYKLNSPNENSTTKDFKLGLLVGLLLITFLMALGLGHEFLFGINYLEYIRLVFWRSPAVALILSPAVSVALIQGIAMNILGLHHLRNKEYDPSGS